MITIFNRRELLITMNLARLSSVRDILDTNDIPYITKTTNLQSASFIGASRSRNGSFGIDQRFSYEYKIFVNKDDYNKAIQLVR